ncbi:MAG TPA: hypothetical protein PK156_40660, partial [Polyangium sp.]|nr:hypothetical protein [Polyangium sp.]
MFTLRIMRNATFVIFFAAASFVACGNAEPMKSDDYCSRRCDCEACTDEERTDCDTDLGDLSFRARNKSCLDPYLAYVVCLIDNGQCTSGVYVETACDGAKTILDNCLVTPSCPFTNNGVCDEPQGTGQCASGSDSNDCNGFSCPFTNNGVCDEPQGTAQCPPGSDFN